MKNIPYVFIAFWCLLAACTKPNYVDDKAIDLTFSVDTLQFDTVFTARGSATRQFKVYNPTNDFIRIKKIFVRSDRDFFRINVDGTSGKVVEDIDIAPKDSTYIFVEVTIDPDRPLSTSPFLVEDYVVFETGNNNQNDVLIQANGQNANYFPNQFARGKVTYLTCDQGEWLWNDDKPYVIYGTVIIDSCTLRIPEGRRIHIHGGVVTDTAGIFNDGNLIIGPHGKLIIEGSSDNPVIIQGDRLEKSYEHVSGQWGRIQFFKGSKGNSIKHAKIVNGGIGLFVDSTAQISLNNTEISNHSIASIIARKSQIFGNNVLCHTTGSPSVIIEQGGYYRFNYCTFANFGSNKEGLLATNFRCPTNECDKLIYKATLNLEMTNSILTSSATNGLYLVDGIDDPLFLKYAFKNCYLKLGEPSDMASLLYKNAQPDFLKRCKNTLVAQKDDILFVSAMDRNYRPDSLAVVHGKALPIPTITTDIEGKPRDAASPDIGCYEEEY